MQQDAYVNAAPLTWTSVVLSVGVLVGLIWLRHTLIGNSVGRPLVRGVLLLLAIVWCVMLVWNTAVFVLARRTG